MTRLLLWEEYKEKHPDGYGYSQFKEYYNRYRQQLNPSMRQIHYAGDKLFVDFSGLTVPVVDGVTGEHQGSNIRGLELNPKFMRNRWFENYDLKAYPPPAVPCPGHAPELRGTIRVRRCGLCVR